MLPARCTGKTVPFLCRTARGCRYRVPRRELFGGSKEERIVERQEIWRDISQGYFADFHEFRKTGGKRFEAADQLCSRKEATRFPLISGRSLTGEGVELPAALKGHVSLVLISFRAFGLRMSQLYLEPFMKEFGSNTLVKVFEVSLVEKLFYRMLRRWMERNLKREIARERHISSRSELKSGRGGPGFEATFILPALRMQINALKPSFMVYTGGGLKAIKEKLKLGNTIVGHAHLLDGEGLVRWRAHATPTERELQTLSRCTRQLLKDSEPKR